MRSSIQSINTLMPCGILHPSTNAAGGSIDSPSYRLITPPPFTVAHAAWLTPIRAVNFTRASAVLAIISPYGVFNVAFTLPAYGTLAAFDTQRFVTHLTH